MKKGNQPSANFVTKEIDLEAFHAGIFTTGARALSPIVMSEEDAGELQSLEQFYDLQNNFSEHLRDWVSYVGPGGIGQYSLIKNPQVNVLGRWDIYFRHPTLEEIEHDLNHYGDQVFGPNVLEVSRAESKSYRGHTVFRLGEDYHYFTGPPRLRKSIITTNVFPGDLPEDLTPHLQQLEKMVGTDNLAVFQSYQFLHADNGSLFYSAFNKPQDYNSSKLKEIGLVEITGSGQEMRFYPDGNKDRPIDFTGLMHFQ